MKKTFFSIFVILLSICLFGCGLAEPKAEAEAEQPQNDDVEEELEYTIENYGGISIAYRVVDEDREIDSDILDKCVDVFRNRLDVLGYTQAVILKSGKDTVYVQIPGVYDPEEIPTTLGSMGKLEFVDCDGKVLLDKTMVKNASENYGPVGDGIYDEHHIVIEFTSEGREAFARATAEVAKKPDGENYISITFDGSIISQPVVTQAITSDTCTISGDFTKETAKELATMINVESHICALQQIEVCGFEPSAEIQKKLDKENKKKFEDAFENFDDGYDTVKYLEIVGGDILVGRDDFVRNYELYLNELKLVQQAEKLGISMETTVELDTELVENIDLNDVGIVTDNLELFENLEYATFSECKIDVKKLSGMKHLKGLSFDCCSFENEKYFAELNQDTIDSITFLGSEIDWSLLEHLKDKVVVSGYSLAPLEDGNYTIVLENKTLEEYLSETETQAVTE